ncbi:MAG: hypothetical protein LBU68_00400 [Rickettsiales bacterium]|jgi:hypothetical protein|nr:hypothetical protein [Rickettsiales bacterium]
MKNTSANHKVAVQFVSDGVMCVGVITGLKGLELSNNLALIFGGILATIGFLSLILVSAFMQK